MQKRKDAKPSLSEFKLLCKKTSGNRRSELCAFVPLREKLFQHYSLKQAPDFV